MGRLLDIWPDQGGGYAVLDEHERAIARNTLRLHGNVARLWCDVIAAAFDAARPRQELESPDEDKRVAKIARVQFFALGVGHSKAALDAALGGNYHHAFFSVRYLCELAAQTAFLRIRPDQARRWYPQLSGRAQVHENPTFQNVLTKLNKELPGERKALGWIKQWAELMDDWGAHPSQKAIISTLAADGDDAKYGTMFNGDQFLASAYYSIALTMALMEEMQGDLKKDSAEWAHELEAFWSRFHLVFKEQWGSDEKRGPAQG